MQPTMSVSLHRFLGAPLPTQVPLVSTVNNHWKPNYDINYIIYCYFTVLQRFYHQQNQLLDKLGDEKQPQHNTDHLVASGDSSNPFLGANCSSPQAKQKYQTIRSRTNNCGEFLGTRNTGTEQPPGGAHGVVYGMEQVTTHQRTIHHAEFEPGGSTCDGGPGNGRPSYEKNLGECRNLALSIHFAFYMFIICLSFVFSSFFSFYVFLSLP